MDENQLSEIGAKQVPNELVSMILDNYGTQMDEYMGLLHNRFVGYISESKLPLPQVIMVLTMLLKEATDEAFAKYLKD